jgi:drug/metabolite transporter (DMT)-like permease
LTIVELGLVFASALLHAIWSVAIKGSRDPLTFNLLQTVTGVVLVAACAPFVAFQEIASGVWLLIAVSCTVHGFYFYWMSRAFEHGDLTLVYPIVRSTPAFMPFVATPLLAERISLTGAVGIATVVSGMWLVQAGRGLRREAFLGKAAVFSYLTLATTVAYSLTDKSVMAQLAAGPWSSPIPRAAFYCLVLSAGNAVVFAPLVLRKRSARSLLAAARTDLGGATAAALVSFASYSLLLKALETAPVSYVVAGRQMSVVFALCLGVLWLGEAPGRVRVLGALTTVVGIFLIATRA